MNMVGHEAKGVHSIVEMASPILQKEMEAAAVHVGKKYRLASVAAENDVVESTGEMNARFTCHGDKRAELVNLSTSRPYPILDPASQLCHNCLCGTVYVCILKRYSPNALLISRC